MLKLLQPSDHTAARVIKSSHYKRFPVICRSGAIVCIRTVEMTSNNPLRFAGVGFRTNLDER